MLDREELTLNNSERKLLWGIYQSLQEIDKKLDKVLVSATREQIPMGINEYNEPSMPLRELKRNDLMALVKELPADKKPEGWSKLTNAELIELLEGEGM